MDTQTIAGFLLINKPKERTSFSVVKQIRRLIGKKVRVGHTGTLDPFATGLLIIAIDRSATKHIDTFLELDKTYIAKGKLGELRDTLDIEGRLMEIPKLGAISEEALTKALEKLGSSYLQQAPIYSALKHEGVPLYALARKKKLSQEQLEAIAKTKQRMVTLYEVDLLEFAPPYFTLKARVSRGTYIRSLIDDIAQQLGTRATTYELERTAIGPFALENAMSLDELTSGEDIEKHLIPIDKMLERIKIATK